MPLVFDQWFLTTSPLIVDKKGRKFDEAGVYEFLKNHPRKDFLVKLLKEINSENSFLPDFICLDSDNDVFFTEVKNKKDLTRFSQLDKKQKKAIRKLSENGYGVLITNIKILSPTDNSPEIIEYNLKEQGRALRKEDIDMERVRIKILDTSIIPTEVDEVAIQTIRVHHLT